jgi:predicted heme/steroid binding protein
MKLILTFLTVLVLAACTDNVVPEDEMIELTLEELAFFDGQDGRKAYIAVDGFIYDVTNDPNWRDGNHQGRFQAGQDLSQEILSSPHGKSFLSRVPKIGTLITAVEEVSDMLSTIASIDGYQSLASLVYSGQVAIDFSTYDNLTIFLPSLEAFEMADGFEIPDDFDPSEGFEQLLGDIDLFDVLRYHMVEQTLLLEALRTGASQIETTTGEFLTVTTQGEDVLINGVLILESDIIAENGVVHILDGVLVPPSIDLSVTVTFKGLNGKVISTETLEIGETFSFPTAPSEGGHRFTSWSTDVTTITEDITVQAVYEKIFMTLEELAQYDGKNGANAYIAYNGVIYDVTGNSNWPNGVHRGYINAGQDITQLFQTSGAPHGTSNITRLPIVAFLQT